LVHLKLIHFHEISKHLEILLDHRRIFFLKQQHPIQRCQIPLLQ
ncbi:unnamed protein product, partial [Allacma fusca]